MGALVLLTMVLYAISAAVLARRESAAPAQP